MLKIWGRVNSINVQKVMWCIGELGLAHERVDAGMEFGGNKEDWYLAMNPNGLVPTIDDDGFVLWESNTIVRYLAAKHDSGGLFPDSPQARADSECWMDWQLSVLLPPMAAILQNLVRKPPQQRDPNIIHAAVEQAGKSFAILDRQLRDRDFVAGPKLTLGDIPIGAMTYRWYAFDIERPELPSLRTYYERLSNRDAFKTHVMLPLT